MPVQIRFERFSPVVQLRADAMLAESLADGVVFGAEEVLPDVAQEMKMADEIRHLGKDRGDGLEDAFAHEREPARGDCRRLP